MPKWIVDPLSWSEELSTLINTLIVSSSPIPINELVSNCLSALVYFLPYIIVRLFNKKYPKLIFCFNLVLGITLISWLVILLWTIFLPQIKKEIDAKECPSCKELIRKAATKCHHCHSSW